LYSQAILYPFISNLAVAITLLNINIGNITSNYFPAKLIVAVLTPIMEGDSQAENVSSCLVNASILSTFVKDCILYRIKYRLIPESIEC
jgi:hypothetical protein